MSKARKHAGRGALAMMAIFLASSGALRIGAGVGAALANSETTAETPSGVAAPSPDACPQPQPPAALAKALLDREGAVSAREMATTEKEAALALATEVIDQRLAEMQKAEEELKKMLKLADGAAETDLARLTAVYEAMKPKEAARIFDNMAPEFAAGFLGRMAPESAAVVLAGMKPEAAYSISVLIAGRNALLPKN